MKKIFGQPQRYVQNQRCFNVNDSRKIIMLKELEIATKELKSAQSKIREIVQEFLKMGTTGDDIADQVFLAVINVVNED